MLSFMSACRRYAINAAVFPSHLMLDLSIVSKLVLQLLHQLHVLFLRSLWRGASINLLLPGVVLGLALCVSGKPRVSISCSA